MTLRSKLLLAQSPLVVGLVALGVVAGITISTLGRGSQRILHDNYRSVLAAQSMKEAIERIDSAQMFLVAGRPDKAAPQEAENRVTFEHELQIQLDNITEKGEREATETLRSRWNGYRALLEKFHALDAEARRRDYFDELEPAFLAVKQAADDVLVINQNAMVQKSKEAHDTAQNAYSLIVGSSLALLLIGFIASAIFTTRLLRPLAVLSSALRRLGQGDAQARAKLDGSDEVATLAREFNTMADRLEQYRKSSLGELLQAQSATQAAIDSLPDPVLLLTAEGGLLSANRAAEALLAVATEGPPFQKTDPAVREAIERVRAHVAAGRGGYQPTGLDETLRIASPTGDRHFLPRASPLYAESGQLSGVTLVLQEVTRLLRFDELKNDLVATVAHEFRTPLTSLRMAIHLCTEGVVGPLTEKQADLLFAAREDCERLQTIVDDLLDLSRIQAGRLELDRHPLAAEELLRETGEAQRARAAERRVNLTIELPPDLGEITADEDRLRLVIDNLLSNAIRHSPEGATVELRARREPGHLRVEVADAGRGIPREYQAAIFEKFFRLPSAPAGGAGLGLYIAKEVVAAHGGTIGVDSDGKSGSVFWFNLPTEN